MRSWIKRLYIFGFIIAVSVSALSCFGQDSSPRAFLEKENVSVVEAGDFAPGQLQAHYEKHRHEFGAISIGEYLDSARALLNAVPGKDVLEKRRENGDILRFRPSTGEFAVMAYNGRIRTYFRTDYRYWSRQ